MPGCSAEQGIHSRWGDLIVGSVVTTSACAEQCRNAALHGTYVASGAGCARVSGRCHRQVPEFGPAPRSLRPAGRIRRGRARRTRRRRGRPVRITTRGSTVSASKAYARSSRIVCDIAFFFSGRFSLTMATPWSSRAAVCTSMRLGGLFTGPFPGWVTGDDRGERGTGWPRVRRGHVSGRGPAVPPTVATGL